MMLFDMFGKTIFVFSYVYAAQTSEMLAVYPKDSGVNRPVKKVGGLS